MKTLLYIILTICTLSCCAQSVTIILDSVYYPHYKISTAPDVYIKTMSGKQIQLNTDTLVKQKAPLKFTLGMEEPEYYISMMMPCDSTTDYCKKYIYDPKYIRIKGDTLKGICEMFRQHAEEQKRFQAIQKKLWAAEDILSLITTDGYITNWKKWHGAVRVYQKFLK